MWPFGARKKRSRKPPKPADPSPFDEEVELDDEQEEEVPESPTEGEESQRKRRRRPRSEILMWLTGAGIALLALIGLCVVVIGTTSLVRENIPHGSGSMSEVVHLHDIRLIKMQAQDAMEIRATFDGCDNKDLRGLGSPFNYAVAPDARSKPLYEVRESDAKVFDLRISNVFWSQIKKEGINQKITAPVQFNKKGKARVTLWVPAWYGWKAITVLTFDVQ